MTAIAREIGRRAAAAEVAQNATHFARLAHFILKNDGKLSRVKGVIDGPKTFSGGLDPLADIVRHTSQLSRISRVDLEKRAAQTPNSIGVDTALAAYNAASRGFIGSLVNAGAFDTMLASMVRLPLATATVGAVSTSATAYQIQEMQMKPLSRLSFTNQNVDPLKAICALVLSKELMRFSSPGTLQLIESELRKAVAKITDEVFISIVASGISANTSTGATGEAIRTDIRAMLQGVTTGQESRLFLITNSTVCKNWSMATDQHGNSAFPELGPQGGTINQILVLVSDAVGSGLAYLIDASSIGANPGELVLQDFGEGSLQFDSAPDSPPTAATPHVSLWQMNLTALRVERYFIVERCAATALRQSTTATVGQAETRRHDVSTYRQGWEA